jgi:hypothetical protein
METPYIRSTFQPEKYENDLLCSGPSTSRQLALRVDPRIQSSSYLSRISHTIASPFTGEPPIEPPSLRASNSLTKGNYITGTAVTTPDSSGLFATHTLTDSPRQGEYGSPGNSAWVQASKRCAYMAEGLCTQADLPKLRFILHRGITGQPSHTIL